MLKTKVAVVLYFRRVRELRGERAVLGRPLTSVAAWTNIEANATMSPLSGHTWRKHDVMVVMGKARGMTVKVVLVGVATAAVIVVLVVVVAVVNGSSSRNCGDCAIGNNNNGNSMRSANKRQNGIHVSNVTSDNMNLLEEYHL